MELLILPRTDQGPLPLARGPRQRGNAQVRRGPERHLRPVPQQLSGQIENSGETHGNVGLSEILSAFPRRETILLLHEHGAPKPVRPLRPGRAARSS